MFEERLRSPMGPRLCCRLNERQGQVYRSQVTDGAEGPSQGPGAPSSETGEWTCSTGETLQLLMGVCTVRRVLAAISEEP